MTMLTRLRRALCRHEWVPMYRGHWAASGQARDKCVKCGVMRRVEP